MAQTSSTSNSSGGSNQDQRTKRLYLEITAAAGNGDFVQAEVLRGRLIENFPMALKEIIGSAEIIENKKAAAIDKQHLAVWDHLYENLSMEEKNCLFYAMKKVVVPPKKVLLSAGSRNRRLFFIDSGKVVIVSSSKGKNSVVAHLGRGDLLGEYTFTSITLCSATAVSHTEVTLYYLERSAIDKWDEKFPGLYGKIEKFCLRHGHIDDIANRKKLAQISRPRYPASGRVVGYLFNKEGQKTEEFIRGELSDISTDGCRIGIKLSNSAMARALLTRQLMMTFCPAGSEKVSSFQVMGRIIKVSSHIHNDYSIHINFVRPISKDRYKSVLKED